jgi:hypothetical protein
MTLALLQTSANAAAHWSRTYGGAGTFEQALDLAERPDGSIIVVGVSDSFGTMSGDAWRLHLTADGGVISEHVYGNALPGGAADAAIDPDGGMAVVGAHTPDIFTDRDAWIHHVDASGIVDWQWSFDADPGMHAFHAVTGTSDGGYLAVGSTAFDSGTPIWAWAVRFDQSGTVLWQTQYNGGVAEHANFVVETTDGGFAIAGWTTSSGAGMTDAWLMKIDALGEIEWQKTYGGENQEEATGLIQTADGGYALSAFTDTFPTSGHGCWVVRVDANGDVLWNTLMGDVWGDFRDIVQTSDGDLVATGRLSGLSTNDLWLVKLADATGDVLWQRAYEGTEGDWGSRTIEFMDADLFVTGIWAFGFAGEDMWLQRTNIDGLVDGCALIVDTDVPGRDIRVDVGDATTIRSAPRPVAESIVFVHDVALAVVDTKCGASINVAQPDGLPLSVRPLLIASNPSAGATRLSFSLNVSGPIRIDVHDVNGRLVDTVVDRPFTAGQHGVTWERSRSATKGVYFITLRSREVTETVRVVVVG